MLSRDVEPGRAKEGRDHASACRFGNCEGPPTWPLLNDGTRLTWLTCLQAYLMMPQCRRLERSELAEKNHGFSFVDNSFFF